MQRPTRKPAGSQAGLPCPAAIGAGPVSRKPRRGAGFGDAAGRRLGSLALALLALSGPARAEFVSNEQLMGWLEEAVRRGGSFKDTTLALGFVTAVHDLQPEEVVCVPDRQRGRELLRAVHDWMRYKTSLWENHGALTVKKALEDLYPCPPGGR